MPLMPQNIFRTAGQQLTQWQVYNFELDDLSSLPYPASAFPSFSLKKAGPLFYRGSLTIEGPFAENVTDAGGQRHLADTYLDTSDWGKGVAFINGFHLGWYWPTRGPQMTLYVPGVLLKAGSNDVIFLEMEKDAEEMEQMSVRFVSEPNFYGPVAPGDAEGAGIIM